MSKRRLAVVTGLCFWGISVAGAFARPNLQQETLRDLAGVWVVVEKLNPEIDQGGLTRDQLQTDAETQLRQAGIRLLTAGECWETPGMPWLYITVAILKASETAYAITIEVSLNQEVALTRAPHVKTFGVTWDTGVNLGVVEVENMATVRERLGALVEKFIADYRAVNSTKSASGGSAKGSRADPTGP